MVLTKATVRQYGFRQVLDDAVGPDLLSPMHTHTPPGHDDNVVEKRNRKVKFAEVNPTRLYVPSSPIKLSENAKPIIPESNKSPQSRLFSPEFFRNTIFLLPQ
eukprot:m.147589 g.147589  ORF g.147589 m.147589 type:complete len:103 (-) comp14988_c0_seq21:5490-5798(-)